jgi:putative ABC transport system permease protein
MIVGAHAVLLFGGYSRNITYGLQTDYVKYGGHLQIQRAGYFRYGSGNPAAYGIANYREIIDGDQHDPELAPMLGGRDADAARCRASPAMSRRASRAPRIATGVVVATRTACATGTTTDSRCSIPPLALTGTGPTTRPIVGTGLARVLQLCGAAASGRLPSRAAAADGGAARLPADVRRARRRRRRPPPPPAPDARIELLAASAPGAPNVARSPS